MFYEAECWAVKNQHKNKLSVADMMVLCWMCDKIRRNRIRNNNIKERVGVASITKKIVKIYFSWLNIWREDL